MLTNDSPRTDLGNAERFAKDHFKTTRFCHDRREWLVWNGAVWKRDAVGAVYQRCGNTLRSVELQATELKDDNERRDWLRHGLNSESEPRMRAMLNLAEKQPAMAVSVAELDSDPMVFNVQNGTIDLNQGVLRGHRAEDLITKISPAAFEGEADCPRWNRFLLEVMGGEIELIEYLQRAVGYTMTGHTKEQVMFMLHGGGANGKSTFLETLRFVFGDYAAVADFNSLMVTKNSGPRNDLAKLQGARFVTASEADENSRLAEVLVKQITGGDTITARQLYKEYVEFIPQYKLWLAMNHLPSIRGTEHAIWRRIHLIPFEVQISEEQRDRVLLEKLKSEAPGIVNWAVEGVRSYQKIGLNPPAVVTEATRKYREAQDVVAQFLDEKCIVDGQGRTGGRSLYTAYKKWSLAAGEREPMTEKRFSKSLADRPGLQKSRGVSGMVWAGVRLMDDVTAAGSELTVN
jgi:putative DNA primase/helicase